MENQNNLRYVKENKNNSLKYMNGLLNKDNEKLNLDERPMTENSNSEENIEYFSE